MLSLSQEWEIQMGLGRLKWIKINDRKKKCFWGEINRGVSFDKT